MAQQREITARWLKFNCVGAIGIAVQLVTLGTLTAGLHFSYLPAAALAVEAAVLHNFFWHERFTWADRSGESTRLIRLLKFNLTTGLVSIIGNTMMMNMLIGVGHCNYLLANCVAIATCSVLNFAASDRFVFRRAA
jgi:putative flippase GtrA